MPEQSSMTPDLDALEQAALDIKRELDLPGNIWAWSIAHTRAAVYLNAAHPAAILALIASVRAAEAALGQAREVVDGRSALDALVAASGHNETDARLILANLEAAGWTISNRARAALQEAPRDA